ncbi:MAG: DNA topoisomerase VI subunit B [Thermoplasmatales archaeon]|nr:DNA topoisomerase VI subunit B [Thermoplasmatales archaeon]
MSIAEELAKKQKEISVAEFFERNKQILGFDNLTRALITCVKEAVDNALDACEEGGILPDILVEIKEIKEDEYRIVVEDNGPGIVRSQIPNVFARLLYGSRFHTLRQARGQQGIGISAVVLYSQLTTGKPAVVTSKIGEGFPAHKLEVFIDTKRNLPNVVKEEMIHWEKKSGTRIEVFVRGKYIKNRKQSVYEYLRSTAIVDPHAFITLIEPDGNKIVFERATNEMPPLPKEINPHPHGIEIGMLLRMLKETNARKISTFLANEFSSVSMQKAKEILSKAGISEDARPNEITLEEAKNLIEAFRQTKFLPPPTNCLSPIGEELIRKGLRKETQMLSPEFIAVNTRSPSVFSGTPFMVETGIVYGGNLPAEERVEILRFANRVPLLYQEGGCVITEAIKNIDWRRYGLEQKGGKGLPYGPAIILVHVASVNVPFTSEAKEAIANIDEIEKEIKLSLQECARKMKIHLSKKEKKKRAKDKFILVAKVLPEIAKKSANMLSKSIPDVSKIITKIMNIIWIEDEVITKNGNVESRVYITNYKNKPYSFTIYLEAPKERIISVSPPPVEIRDRVVKWEIKDIKPTEKVELSLALRGDEFENNIYVGKIDPINVIGAEKWEGEE